VWATRVDITDKKCIEQLAILDELTGTYNRRYFNEKIVEEVNRSKRDQKMLAVAMFDIDHFKMINDHYGHQRGDEVLKAVSDVIKASFHRSNEFCFRMGGEEFLVLSSFKTEVEFMDYLIQLKNKVEMLKIENPLAQEPYLTISIGAGFWMAEEIPFPDQIYHSVDAALYEAKANGRNQVVMTAIKTD
jgi:diguanylate cyclase (GGDEF)-like protein